MNPRPFPKPPPADPLPLDIWLDQTDRAEVGREPFFRGREVEFDLFRRAVSSLQAGRVGGGTMIFQGAPGAGKSALMAECLEAVRRHSTPADPWVAVDLRPDALRSPVAVVRTLIQAVSQESERLRDRASGTSGGQRLEGLMDLGRTLFRELSDRGGGAWGLSVGGRRDHEAEVTASWVFQNAAPLLAQFHLVVGVDEAQSIPVAETTTGVMGCLHHPPEGIPLVGAFFGLSDTQEVLRQCGLSRFARGRVVNLEPLPTEEAAEVIRAMFEAYGFSDSPADQDRWVTRLVELSQGWPQHLNSVSVAAGEILKAHGGRMEAAGLTEAMAVAEEYRREYYAARLAAGASRAWVYKGLAEAAAEQGGRLSIDDIEFLTERGRGKTGESLDRFLTQALHAGLLAPVRDWPDHYRIPIPSFGDYLRALPVEPPAA